MDFTTITACGECCAGCTKKLVVFAKVVQSPMDIVQNGNNLTVVQYINVQDSIMYNSVDCGGSNGKDCNCERCRTIKCSK